METRATLRYGKISPQKVRDITSLIIGKEAKITLGILANLKKGGAVILIKLIKSALANAKAGETKEPLDFYLERIVVDGGPVAKRFRAAAMGRSTMIRKRTTHITVVLRNRENGSES